MRLFLYCVFDSASGVYDRPFCAQSDGAAIRSFGDIASDAEHPIGKHPECYSLYRVGEFDDNAGALVAEDAICIGKAHELVAAARRIGNGQMDAFEDPRLNMSADDLIIGKDEEIRDAS